jgi:hypothetical protein
MTSEYLQRLDVQGHLRVRAALLEWNPIGAPVPPDEYDMYTVPVVRMLDANRPRAEIISYLRSICVERMECSFNELTGGKVVNDLFAFWPDWKARVIAERTANEASL